MNDRILTALERNIRSAAAWEGDDAASYVRWFADPQQQSLVAQVGRTLLGEGVSEIDRADFAALWERTAILSGRAKTTFLPHHFKLQAKARYGHRTFVDECGHKQYRYVTQYPPLVLSDNGRTLRLNPIVAKAVDSLVAELGLPNSVLAA